MTDSAKIPALFLEKKAKITAQLTLPDSDYTDASPKGSVDVGIRELIRDINAHAGLVTTSSCAGRASVFLEGRKKTTTTQHRHDGDARLAGAVGGKGGGGRWLYVSHEPLGQVAGSALEEVLFDTADDTGAGAGGEEDEGDDEERLVHFKFEPMILHILTASHEHAQSVLRCGLEAGFRESGAINLLGQQQQQQQQAIPMVAIRSMGLGLESIIGMQTAGKLQRIVTPEYLAMLVRISNDRFQQNADRIERFRLALAEEFGGGRKQTVKPDWEDADARKERKKAEGMRRRDEVAREREKSKEFDGSTNTLDEQPLTIS